MITCSGCGITSTEIKERVWGAMVTYKQTLWKRELKWALCITCAAKEERLK